NRNADLVAEYARRDSEKNVRKRETNDALRFKAELHQTRFEFDRTEETYRLLLRLDSMNVDNLWAFAGYLFSQNQKQKSQYYSQKCFDLVKSEDLKATFLNNIGLCYADLNNAAEAEKNFLKAFEIQGRLAKSNPAQFEPGLAAIANNLGGLYKVNNR